MTVVDICADLLRIDTSNPGGTEEEAARYITRMLERAGIGFDVVEPAAGRCSVISACPGADLGLPPLLVHGHLDVVPAAAEGWRFDPFGGVVADGCLWGRGAADMKGGVAMMLDAQCALAAAKPRRTIVFAYFADEEAGGGLGSGWIARHRPELFQGAAEAIGELGGFAVTMPGGRRLYPLQVAERGMLWLRVMLSGRGGHAAFATGANLTVELAELIQRVAELRTTAPPPEAFGALLDRLAELDPATEPRALLAELAGFGAMAAQAEQTRFAPTVVNAGTKPNMLPDRGELLVDCRYVPGDERGALDAFAAALRPGIEWETTASSPAIAAPIEGPLPAACARAVAACDPGAQVVPFVCPAGTDAQRLGLAGIAGYGFMPLALPAGFDFPAMLHATDERIPVAALTRGSTILHELLSIY